MKNTFQVSCLHYGMLKLVFIITAAYEPECGSVHVAHASMGSMQKVGKVPVCCLETCSKESLILLVGNYSSEPASLSSKETCFNHVLQLVELFTSQLSVAWQNSLCHALCLC